jgi:hypothetical protein
LDHFFLAGFPNDSSAITGGLPTGSSASNSSNSFSSSSVTSGSGAGAG